MGDVNYRFKLGTYDCQIISDGTLKIPGDRQMELECLFVRTGKHNVLIDSGEGKGINPTSGFLLENMLSAGINPGEVDRVIITHAHVDHIGGLLDAKGNPNFPRARYALPEKEWDSLLPGLRVKPGQEAKNEDIHTITARRNIISIQDRLDVFHDESEIVPGFNYVPAPGHTPGVSIVVITSGKDQLLCVGDLLHEPAEFTQPRLWEQWDVNAAEATRSRIQVVARAVNTKALVFICHFPFPGLGYIVKKGHTLDWEPFKK